MNEPNNNINNIIEENNNDQNPNIANDINSNNNINNQNNNNINNNPILFNNQNRDIYPKKYTSITISFLIILLINIIIEIYSNYEPLNYRKYVFQYAPINEKYQYYRFISSYFIHYGTFHLLLELYISFNIFYYFENIMGTMMTICFIMISMLMNSILHYLMMPIVIFLCKITNMYYDLNYDYESSLTSVLFTMSNFYLLFKEIKDKRFDLFYTVFIKVKYITFIALVTLYCFTPNKSFFSNLSGIITGYLFKFFPFIFLPKVTWINEFENHFRLKRFDWLYRCINYKNKKMRNALNELQSGSVVDESLIQNRNENYGNDFNNTGRQMNELSSNTSNNIINENN
jgi:membrane associated rhomboid family serine protease